jgi:hypothetical protein
MAAIIDYVLKLKSITEEEWSTYAFSRDPIGRKISKEKQMELTRKANECGKEQADKLLVRFGKAEVLEYANQLGLKITEKDSEGTESYIVFANFNYPDKITIYNKNVEYMKKMIADEHLEDLLEHVDITSMLLAHEMFHYMEGQDKNIFTQREKVELWSIGRFNNRSKIIAIGEIAAMSFAKELLNISYNPYIFDTLMLYPHNKEKAADLMNEIFVFHKE